MTVQGYASIIDAQEKKKKDLRTLIFKNIPDLGMTFRTVRHFITVNAEDEWFSKNL